ncbi:FadR/GntR family transcriptional regulator [Gordonia sp. DT218]|uniref:FadR/GntR family transcriptional regulator n=1 Tax=Gordonia sp. DT218 TaxID=3416659 RepID=UPI003CE94011
MRPQSDRKSSGGGSERLAVGVARRLEQEIKDRGWPIGEVLGSETALREQLGVSRSILREAVRLLENSQAAQMRQGPGGGLVVSVPDPRSSIRGLVISLEYLGATVDQLVYARSVFERMAIDRIMHTLTEGSVQELRRSAAGAVGPPIDFHVTVGELSGNPLLELFVDVLARLTAAYTQRAYAVTDDRSGELQHAAQLHSELADAIIAGDKYLAHQKLLAHLDDTTSWLRMYVAPLPGERTATRPMDPDPGERPREKKLAEHVAGWIHDDIVDEGRQIGEVVGSEPYFVEKYGVSRSVFREAIRILEYYRVAQMRRGPGGGLVVLAPDPLATVETIALYLDYRGISIDDLRAVRDELEMGVLTQVMRTAPPTADAIGVDGRCCSACLRDRMADLSGDPVLVLFRSVLAVVWKQCAGPQFSHEVCVGGSGAPAERDELDALVEAVVSGDTELASFRLRAHLQSHQEL